MGTGGGDQVPTRRGCSGEITQRLAEPVVTAGLVLFDRQFPFERTEDAGHRALGKSRAIREIGDSGRSGGQRPEKYECSFD